MNTEPAPTAPANPPKKKARINSAELLRGMTTLEIQHFDQCYTLRLTRENKLILTK